MPDMAMRAAYQMRYSTPLRLLGCCIVLYQRWRWSYNGAVVSSRGCEALRCSIRWLAHSYRLRRLRRSSRLTLARKATNTVSACRLLYDEATVDVLWGYSLRLPERLALQLYEPSH